MSRAKADVRSFGNEIRAEQGLLSTGTGDDDDGHGHNNNNEEIDYIFPDEDRIINMEPVVEQIQPELTLIELTQGFNRDAAKQQIEEIVYGIAVVCNFIAFRLTNSSGGKNPILFDKETQKQLSLSLSALICNVLILPLRREGFIYF